MKPLTLSVPCNFGCGGQLIHQLSTRKYDMYKCNKCGKRHWDYNQQSDDCDVDMTFTVNNSIL